MKLFEVEKLRNELWKSRAKAHQVIESIREIWGNAETDLESEIAWAALRAAKAEAEKIDKQMFDNLSKAKAKLIDFEAEF